MRRSPVEAAALRCTLIPLLLLLPLLGTAFAQPQAAVEINLPTSVVQPTPLPTVVGNKTDKEAGIAIDVDSISFYVTSDSENSPDVKQRWLSVGGEIHYGRVPQARWREEMMRMKAGGLDLLDVYTFWNHHEEHEGVFDMSGRRNYTFFLETAKSVGLAVTARIGPWSHGEGRNGGHPDWLIEKSKTENFRLRSTDAGYLKYVRLYYQQMATMMNGLFFKDNGPVFAVQIDNETSDWKYLLALKEIALQVGIAPAFFLKTGWPTPAAGYPSDYPMLPLFGQYPDLFWTNDMSNTTACDGCYLFGAGESVKGYPMLNVELGGGMASAYNHRVTLASPDMPALHLMHLASGVNQLGYYMYHGGNNPTPQFASALDPTVTLQESSFQPAGAANPMPSFSYDFFAPLGEFGQPRLHYHQMRRLHMFVNDYGGEVCPWELTVPTATPSSPDDLSTLRWAIRSDNRSGLVFVMNHKREMLLEPKESVRFALSMMTDGGGDDGKTVLEIPHANSPSLTVASDIWYHFPFNFKVVDGFEIVYATAQLLFHIEEETGQDTVFFVAVEGITPELSIPVADGITIVSHTSGNLTKEDNQWVLRSISPSMDGTLIVRYASSKVLTFVVLPSSMQDRVWRQSLGGRYVAIVGQDNVHFALTDQQTPDILKLRINGTDPSTQSSFSIFPVPKSAAKGTTTLPSKRNGVFVDYTLTQVVMEAPPTVSVQLVDVAGPPRDLPLSPAKKAQEPLDSDWAKAARYNVTISGNLPTSAEVRLNVKYLGDSARFYLGDQVFTDNWQSGYIGDGAMEVGLSYLSSEIPVHDGTVFTLEMLPLKKSDVGTRIYMRYPPDFPSSGVVLELQRISLLMLNFVDITILY